MAIGWTLILTLILILTLSLVLTLPNRNPNPSSNLCGEWRRGRVEDGWAPLHFLPRLFARLAVSRLVRAGARA